MRLQQHINEGYSVYKKSLFELNKDLKIQCRSYLKLIKGKIPLYRGMTVHMDVGVKDVRQHRTSLGMDQKIADKFNAWLQENGHTRRDNSVMTSSNKKQTDLFGTNIYYIFPIGKFDYTWIKSNDVNIGYKDWDPIFLQSLFGEDKYEKWLAKQLYPGQDIDKNFDNFFTTNKQFDIAYKMGYEIWMNSKQYYFVNIDDYIWDENKQRFWNKV